MGQWREAGKNRSKEERRIDYPQYAENYAYDEFPW